MSWLRDHAINPRLAAVCGVRGELGKSITFQYRERRTITRIRKPDGSMRQPGGEPLRLYWPVGGWGAEDILLTEGEGDTLAAASVLFNDMGEPRQDLPEILNGVVPVGLPGVSMPSDRVCAFLRAFGVRRVWVCLDGDSPGQSATERLVYHIDLGPMQAIPIRLPAGKDLSDILSSLDNRTDYLANLLADSLAATEVVAA